MRLVITIKLDLPRMITVPGVSKMVSTLEKYARTLHLGMFEGGKPSSSKLSCSYVFEQEGSEITVPPFINEA